MHRDTSLLCSIKKLDVNITDFARVKRENWYKDAPEPIYLGFVAEGGNAENAVRFFEFINE